MNESSQQRIDAAVERVSEFAPRPKGQIAVVHADNPPPANPLGELLKMLDGPVKTPTIGIEAADRIRSVAHTTATDARAMAQDHVDRALALQQQIETFATVVLHSGDVLATSIEDETRREFQLTMLMRHARDAVARPPKAELDEGQPPAG